MDTLEAVVTSPVFGWTVIAVFVGGLGYSIYAMARAELGFQRFVREHGFRRAVHSTMWLARVIEGAAAIESRGQWDGLPVTIHRHRHGRRGGMTIVVTTEADLLPGSPFDVTLGAWTTPPPPALAPQGFTARGPELRLDIGDPPDPTPYVAAAVEYARALAQSSARPLAQSSARPQAQSSARPQV